MAVVRMKDIAKELGVSVVTVSKALRNHDDISEETRERVLLRMRELNYRPNLAARALVTGRSNIVGFVVPGLLHSFFAEVAKGLMNVFRKNGYGLVIATSEEDPELECQEIDQLLARRVDALVIATTQKNLEMFRRIESENVPYVLIDRRVESLDANFVGVDDRNVGAMATEHLIQTGRKRIACVYATRLSPSLDRLEGYKQALATHGIELRAEYLKAHDAVGDATENGAYAVMKELMALKEPPDAVYCFNDPTAMSAMKAALDSGMRVPGDVAIVGSGNIRYGDFLRVPLTTIDQNSIAMGEQAGKLALSMIALKTQNKPRTIYMEPKLIVRSSSTPTR